MDNLVQGNAKSLCRDKAKGFWREGFTQVSVDGESPTEAQKMQDANYKEETRNKHLFRLLIIKDWEKKNLSLENSEHHQAQ